MIDEILEDAAERMDKSIASLEAAFARIRTGRAHPSFLDSVDVDYYGSARPKSNGEYQCGRGSNAGHRAVGSHDGAAD